MEPYIPNSEEQLINLRMEVNRLKRSEEELLEIIETLEKLNHKLWGELRKLRSLGACEIGGNR